MLELTRQEKNVIVFLMATTLLGIGIVCYKHLRYQPKIEIISNKEIEGQIRASKIININTAKKNELMRLKGIGPAMADAIIEYRAAHGRFTDKEELKNVKGIGPAKFEKLREFVKVE